MKSKSKPISHASLLQEHIVDAIMEAIMRETNAIYAQKTPFIVNHHLQVPTKKDLIL